MSTVTYLTMDPVGEGVGTSQVARYVVALARRGVAVELHSFERAPVPPWLTELLARAGVQWHVHPFGALGSLGALGRLARATRVVQGRHLVHGRSDLAAAAASLRRGPFIWDMRAFFADQRIALGTLRPGSPEERALRGIERRLARRAAGIVTLTHAAVEVLADRHGRDVAARCHVIPTCTDLDAFRPSPFPDGPVRYLLAGTLNAYYDVPAMVDLVRRASHRRATELHVLTPGPTAWDDLLAGADLRAEAAAPEMPARMAAAHVGLSVCRFDAGVSLTAALPTKLGEFLASGRPVVVNPGLGDMDAVLAAHRCGVVLRSGASADLDRALDELDALLADPDTPDRCRAAAVATFDLDDAVTRLAALYESLG